MRIGMLFLFLLFGSFAKAQDDINVLHYSFAISLGDNSDTIIGIANIVFVRKAGVSDASFDLTGVNQNGKGMKVTTAYGGKDGQTQFSFSQVGEKLSIQLPKAKEADTLSLMITYLGVPDDGLIISKNKYGNRTFFADNWPNRAHHWLPCIDRPDDKASFEFSVVAPSHYDVVSNGVKIEEETLRNGMKATHWKEDIPLPTKVMVIGVAKFATKVFDDGPKDMPVSAWVYPQDSTKGFYDYALTTEIVKFFSGYIAPYPYKKLANVQSKTVFGGMENASCIFYSENSVTGDRSEEDLYAHEIAHQWFGDMASEKSFAHLWLSEGFATYLTDVYFEQKYGKEAVNKRLQKERDEAVAFAKKSLRPVVDSTTDLMSLLNANSYQKGAWVLHMLRQEVGDSAFHKIIQAYYNQYKGGNADTRDFEAMAEKVSGKELKWFFDQWLYTSGVPQLETKIIEKNGKPFFSIRQQQAKLFAFNLEIAVASRFNKTLHFQTIRIKERETLIAHPMDGKIVVDPNTKLLFDGAASPRILKESR